MNKFSIPFSNVITLTPGRIVEPYSWVEHVPFAFWVTKAVAPRLLVELGVHSGNSYNAFCQAVKAYATNTSCYGIDTWRGDEHTGFYDESIYTDLWRYQKEHFPFSQLLKMTFDEGAAYFSEGSIDLLHIDGLHYYESVKHDFETWLPKMSDRGVILFHDTNVRERDFGVWKLWEELQTRYPAFEFKHGHGLGVVSVGTIIPDSLSHFFAAPHQDSLQSHLFSALGSRILLAHSDKIQRERLSEQALHLAETERQLADREQRVADLERRLTEREQQVAEQDGQIVQLRERLVARDREAAGLRTTADERAAQAADLNAMLTAVITSRSWQITEPLRKTTLYSARGVQRAIGSINRTSSLVKKTLRAYAVLGFSGGTRKVLDHIRKGFVTDQSASKAIAMVEKNLSLGRFGYVSHDPLVSVLAVNLNGAEHLPEFLVSLSRQSYRNFELIIVDNGSTDHSERIVEQNKSLFPHVVRFVKTGKNLGFAEGNNVALDHAKGEFLALLNIDTRVHEDWLKELVDALRDDGSAAAAASKILFWSRFHDMEIACEPGVTLDLTVLERSLTYKKFFVRCGKMSKGIVESDSRGKIVISLPVQEPPITMHLSSSVKGPVTVAIRTRTKMLHRLEFSGRTSLDLNFSIDTVQSASFIINNAGSSSDSHGMPCDRGIGEYDQGQYDQKCDVPFFCGGAALLRRAAILRRPLFVSEFFAYYEDSELSRWLTAAGFRIVYAPRSIVFHRHSAVSSEGSLTWHYLVQRSRSIFLNSDSPVIIKRELAAARVRYATAIAPELLKILDDHDERLIRRLAAGEPLVTKRGSVGVYNSFWNTRGGGESHALSIAAELQRHGPVELISETDFDLDSLAHYFSLDLSQCRKLVLPKMDTEWTESFSLFINSTFCSNLVSRASSSWYIVSFPHRGIPPQVLDSYYFLFNSEYTRRWAKHYWGSHIQGDVLYPVRMLRPGGKKKLFSVQEKDKIILSVGRFYPFDHSKKQLEIAKAYRALAAKSPGADEWKLILAGSLDYTHKDHVDYFESVKRCLSGLNAEVLPNIERDSLERLFCSATLYVQATGMGHDRENDPDKFEHFGITPVEAMQQGCIPVVFDTGGPAELVRQLGVGYLFSCPESLQTNLHQLIARDFSALLDECLVVHERATEFVNGELCKPLKLETVMRRTEPESMHTAEIQQRVEVSLT